MFQSNPDDKDQIAFAAQVTMLLSGDKAKTDADDVAELVQLAEKIGLPVETKSVDGIERTCMWVCNNNHGCNPSNPPPNCGRCREVCF